MRQLLASLTGASLAAMAVAQSPLTTLFAGGNTGNIGGGIYFDLNVTYPAGITILQIDVNGGPIGGLGGIAGTLDVFTIPGTRTGNQTNLAAWVGPSSLGNPVTTLPNNTPTVCVLATQVYLPAGSHGVAFRANGFQHGYTNGTGGNQNYSNAHVALAAGEASNVAFAGGLFTPRVVNCNLHYSTSQPGTVLSTITPYGTGCVFAADSCFYENFATAAAFDLANSGMTLIHTGAGYLALPGIVPFVAPSAAATTLALTDNSETTVTLSSPLRVGRANSTTALTVCSNGFVSVASGNGVGSFPTVATFLNAPRTGWWCWHDFNPAFPGSGQVKFEEVAGVAYVTWQGVWDSGGTTTANASTFQFQFDLAAGHVHVVWQQMSSLGNSYLVGFSEGGVSADPGNTNLSALLPLTFSAATFAIQPLWLAVSPRPIVATTINLTTSNITPTTPFGAVAFGLNRFGVPIDLTSLGMPGCFQYHDILVTSLYLPFGATSVMTPLTVPNMLGLHLQVQAFNYDPAAQLTLLGAVSSRAFDLLCGDW